MTVQSAALVSDLKELVLRLEDDLRERVQTQPEVLAAWQDEHRRSAAAERTASTWQAWRDDRVTQAAVAWVLTTVFVRFCEDNTLLRPVWISGPPARRQEALDAEAAYFRAHPEDTHREWLLQAIEHLRRTPATAALVDERSPLWAVSPSGRAATTLLAFWRGATENGELVRDFADPTLSTRFLGDLYENLSQHARDQYALRQTPEFVEEFILDRTLDPALEERPLEGFKLIDPACGSGHFLLGSFARFHDRWQRHAPGLEPRVRVQKALDAVWGVDINLFAVAIARFRLLLAALGTLGAVSLEGAPGFDVHVLAGDSLYFANDPNQDALVAHESFAYSTEQAEALEEALQLGQYDVVVANPPYITVKDPKLNAAYRARYNHCRGTYALTVPFMELLFKLAKRNVNDRPAGWVGQITSNSFMKRGFGTSIIEGFLAQLDLVEVIDTSGAFIPGHGTPTAIIVGRNRVPQTTVLRAVLGIRSEPGRPQEASRGIVWRAITNHLDDRDYQDAWISVVDLERSVLERHPWSLAGGGAPAVSEVLNRVGNPLGRVVTRIGFFGDSHADEAFFMPGRVLSRASVPANLFFAATRGDATRDWVADFDECALMPYDEKLRPLSPESLSGGFRLYWPLRTLLWNRQTFGGLTYLQAGRSWLDWHQLPSDKGSAEAAVAFAEIATHNHFVLARERRVFNRTAPVIKLPKGASEDDHLKLLGVLNSSTACFWLRQNCFDKGRPGAEAAGADEPWEHRFQFSGTTIHDFPLAKDLPLELARALDSLAQGFTAQKLCSLIASCAPTANLLREAESTHTSLRGRMIAQQEELDWEVYRSYGLIDEALTYRFEPPEIGPSERAFAIRLARAVEAGDEATSWFSHWNHRYRLVTEIPEHWPQDYRDLVQRRIDAIEAVDAIRLLETPEYKRRWSSEPFQAQAEKALRNWLLDRLEDRDLWFSRQGHPTPRSIAQLADELGRDAEFVSVVELWRGKGVRLLDALGVLLESEAVPYLAAYRLKDPGLRKFVDWQRTWELQRQEDAMRPAQDAAEAEKKGANARADKFAATIPVPPKYTSTDFRKSSYWSARGKLDVPKERFIVYPGAGRATDPTALLGWAGWDHAQQSLALATIIAAREADGASDEVLVPLVAGMAELQPWVQQWHAEVDPAFGQSPAEFTGQELARRARQVGRSLEQLAAWRPPAATRGRRAKA